MRIGWLYGPRAVCEVLDRIRGPFNTSAIQQAVGAAAIADHAHVAASVAHNGQWRTWLTREIRALGLRVDDSATNFLLLHFAPGAKDAAGCRCVLERAGIILRASRAITACLDCLRLTVGTRGRKQARRRGRAATISRTKSHEQVRQDSRSSALVSIGSSIAHAAWRGGLRRSIVRAMTRPQMCGRARKAKAVASAGHDHRRCQIRCSRGTLIFVILCTPVGAYPSARAPGTRRPALKKGAILSDVGSVKGAVIRDVGPFVPAGVHFVPAHIPSRAPNIPGPWKRALQSPVRRTLVRFPTPLPGSDAVRRSGRLKRVLGKRCGASCRCDGRRRIARYRAFAMTSHLPHLIAYNIVGHSRDDLETGDQRGRSHQIFGERISRLHPHRRVRSHHVARHLHQQSRGGSGGAWPLQRGSRGAGKARRCATATARRCSIFLPAPAPSARRSSSRVRIRPPRISGANNQ